MRNDKMNVGVIFGGRSGEHEVSLMSARSVLNAIDPQKYTVTQIAISHEGVWMVGEKLLDQMVASHQEDGQVCFILPDPTKSGLYTLHANEREQILENLASLDVAFPVLHGTFGEDGTIQGLFEMAGIAYVGAGVLGSALGMDKGIFKDVMRANDVPIVESLVVLRSEVERHLDDILARAEGLAPYPLFTKPANLGSSVGISKCHNRSDLLEGLMEACRYDRRILIERGINAREIEVSVLGNEDPIASVPGEVIPSREFYSYEAKYIDNLSELRIPAPIPFEAAERIRQIAIQAYRAVDCAGMARADFIMDKDTGEIFINEINTIPGFTEISMYPKLWAASGLSYPALVDRLIELALERKADRDRNEWRYNR
jgi:D-alanine-D-alanine ligase